MGVETRLAVVLVLVVVLLEFEDECEDDDEHDMPGYQGSAPLPAKVLARDQTFEL
jgi:hypothetical protein